MNAIDYTPVFQDAVLPDNLTAIDLPGQFDGIPGGTNFDVGGFAAADPAGIGMVYTNPAVNPNQTGGWMTLAASLAQAASGAFIASQKGSVSPSVPAPKAPGTGTIPNTITKATGLKLGVIAAIGVGVVGVALLIHYA